MILAGRRFNGRDRGDARPRGGRRFAAALTRGEREARGADQERVALTTQPSRRAGQDRKQLSTDKPTGPAGWSGWFDLNGNVFLL